MDSIYESRQRNNAGPEDPARVRELARTIIERNGDHWLQDFLRYKSSRSRAALFYLLEAMHENQLGEHDLALASARKAARAFRTDNNLPGSARAQFEEVYALHRASRGNDCLEAGDVLHRTLDPTWYLWLKIQTTIELASCDALVGDMGASLLLMKSAVRDAHLWGFTTLALRGLGLLAELNVTNGNDAEAWKITQQGMQAFVSQRAPPMRAYQFYAGIAFSAEHNHEWDLAVALNREANWFGDATGNLAINAMAHYRLGSDALMISDNRLAAEQFAAANRIFASLPQTATWKAYRSYGELILAGLNAQKNQISNSAKLLADSQPDLRNVQDYVLQLTYLQIEGDLNLRSGKTGAAKQDYIAALEIGQRWLGKLPTNDDRLAWNAQMGNIYRALVRLYALHDGDPTKAWETWQQYRAVRANAGLKIEFGSIAKSFTQSLKTETLISYVVFDDGIGIWLADDRGFHFHWQPISASDLEQQVADFRILCANRMSDLHQLGGLGRQLYAALVAPVEHLLDPRRTLIIDADASLNPLPFSALMDPANHYLLEKFALVFSPGVAFQRSAATEEPRSIFAGHALVVASGKPSGADHDLLPLEEAVLEAQDVAAHFRDSTVLSGASATLSRFDKEITRSESMHFAGHAVLHGGQTGLVFSADTANTVSDAPALFSAQNTEKGKLHHLRLVVLAACSTAAGDTEDPLARGNLVVGFLRSGVSHVIGTLWDVDSSATRALVKSFYWNLEKDSTVAIAVRLAQLRIFSDPHTAHPYYWAPIAAFGGS